ncbi:hypothetical protein HanIR_Chr07g0325141 [Helianthus annuus]|nr:hypothetical protein HanIR_Chr07g0325141 [Helianthus annuus]
MGVRYRVGYRPHPVHPRHLNLNKSKFSKPPSIYVNFYKENMMIVFVVHIPS